MWDKGYLPSGEGVDYTSRDPIPNIQAACDNDDEEGGGDDDDEDGDDGDDDDEDGEEEDFMI